MGALSSADAHGPSKGAPDDLLSWPTCFSEGSSIPEAAAGLQRVSQGWLGSHGHKSSRAPTLLPFLDREASLPAQDGSRRATG